MFSVFCVCLCARVCNTTIFLLEEQGCNRMHTPVTKTCRCVLAKARRRQSQCQGRLCFQQQGYACQHPLGQLFSAP